MRRAPGVNRAFPPPSVDELQTCAQKLRNSGRLLSVLNDLFRQLERVPSDPAAPVDEQENAGPSQFAVDAYLHRLSPTVAISDLGALVAQMRDPRLRELGRRMVWDAVGPDKIPRDQLGDYVRFLRRRLLGRADARWRTIAAARHELAELTQRLPTLDADHAAAIARYLDYLEQTASS